MMALAARWERFWFAPEPAATMAFLRIAVAAVTLAWALAYAPDLATFTSPHGIVPGGAAPYRAVHLLLIGAALLLLVGYRSRLAAALVFGCLAWLHHVDPWTLNSGDALLRDVAFLLALAPAGACLSLDAALERRATSVPLVSPWALRLVQVQVSVMYLVAVTSKLSGARWRDGTAASFPPRIPAMARWAPPEHVIASPLVAHVLTWGVVGTELAIGVLVWNRRARPWVLGMGVLLHVGIEVTLRVGFFSWIVLAAYVAFVPPELATRWVAALRARATGWLRLSGARGSGSRSGSPRPTRSAGCRARGSRRHPSASAPGAGGSTS